LSGGTVALSGPAAGGVTANNFALGSGAITFNGGTLQLYGYNLADNSSGFGSLTNDLVIASGQSGTILSGPRYTFGSKVTGDGTLNLNVDYVRDDIGGNWTNFTGALNVRNTTGTPPSSTSDDFRVATTSGFPKTRLALGTNVFMYSRATAGSVIPIGEFSATTNTSVSAGFGSGAGAQNAVMWRVGGLNTDATNAAVFAGSTALIKEGGGTWILTGASTNTGATTVSNGTLLVHGALASSAVTVRGGTLGGNGGIGGAVSIRTGATLSPGASIGTLTVSNTVTLFAGAMTLIELSKSPTANDVLKTTGLLTFAGDLIVANIGSHALLAGDSFKIFDAASSAGSFNSVTLPDLNTGLAWDTNNLYTSGTLAVVSLTPLEAWGDNGFGQSAARPDVTNAAAIAAGGYHSLALLNNGSVIAWGDNFSGQCNVPANATNVVAISAGGSHTLVALADGTVTAWGANDSGQTSVPANATNVVALAGGDAHSLALRGDGTLVAWGDNSWGQTNVPADATNIVAIAAGAQHSLALRADGTVLAWGGNLGSFGTYAGQANVPWDLGRAVAIAAGGFHSLAARNDGTVIGWGDNSAAQISVPPDLTNAVAVAAGYAHSLALGADGVLTAWGDNLYGQSSVHNLGGVMAIAAGSYHSLALQGSFPAAPQLLNAVRTGNTFAVSIPTIRGKASILLYKNSLIQSNWNFLKATAGDGSQKSLTDPEAGAPQRFYRVWIP
jgi:autotransporter-associated beta strand protein